MRRKVEQPAEGHGEAGVAKETAAPASTPPDRECTDAVALHHAAFLVERVRMFKLPNNHVYLIKAPDGTVRIWSKSNG